MRNIGKRTKRRSGLTLLELLLVVFILAAIAVTAISITSTVDEQLRFEDTRARLALLRRGAIGPQDAWGEGAPLMSGFVADYGRLPASIEELLDETGLAAWAYDPSLGIWSGWRGSYVQPLAEIGGGRSFRDGWGNPGGAPLYGWRTFVADPAAGTLLVESFGGDGAPGGEGYAADYPPAGFLVERLDHQVNLKGWAVTVRFTNPTDSPVTPGAVRLQLHFPEDGRFPDATDWPPDGEARDRAPGLSAVENVPAVPPGGDLKVAFRFQVEVDGSLVDKRVPWGHRALSVVDEATGERVPAGSPRSVRLFPRAELPEVSGMTWELR